VGMEILSMSTKERHRLVVLGQVEAGRLTVAAAAGLLGLSERQARRQWKRYRLWGDAGLVHGLRGRPGNRRGDPGVRERAVSLYREHYADFGCTLACEYLAERHGLVVDDQTLRRWLTGAGLWRRRRKSAVKRRRRPRKACFGELVQLDGSHHDWFEGRNPHFRGCVLMVMIDDATGLTLARFFESETTEAAMTIFREWALAYGLPVELYPDQDSIYRVNGAKADAIERRTGRRPLTQMGRALKELGVKLTCAKSPQAKGRVERMNGTLQDRLVKALRVAPGGGISEIDAANAYLEQAFLPRLNAKFTVAAADQADVHRPTGAAELDGALCVKEERKVGRDQCVRWSGQVMQLVPGRGLPSLSGKTVAVHQGLGGAVTVHWRDQAVPWREAPTTAAQAPAKPPLPERVAGHGPPNKPAANHPWRGAPRRAGAGSATGSAAPRPPLRQPQPAA